MKLDFVDAADNSQNLTKKDPVIKIFPLWYINNKSKDLMVKGRDFFAFYDQDTGLWTTDESVALNTIDTILEEYRAKHFSNSEHPVVVQSLNVGNTGEIDKWHHYVQKQLRDNYKELDQQIIFANQVTTRSDYASKKLPYSLEEGDISAYETLVNKLYSPIERDKIEWAIGSVISGDSKKNQKMFVFYGPGGTGKSTVLDIIEGMFEGYTSTFNAKDICKNSSSFPLESFKNGPLVSIQSDGNLMNIEDNSVLNSIVSHDTIEINPKFQSKYTMKLRTTLFMGTNKPVKITDAKSGLIRRVIDISPTGETFPQSEYDQLIAEVKNEYGAIAHHCLQKYKELGKSYYSNYIPTAMLAATNDFYDFLDYWYDEFVSHDPMTLKEAFELANRYAEFANLSYKMNYKSVKNELKNYYELYEEEGRVDGKHVRHLYTGFKREKFKKSFEPCLSKEDIQSKKNDDWLELKEQPSLLDVELKDCLAQYGYKRRDSQTEAPRKSWDTVTTKLKDIDTSKVHYVKAPENHIFIDFDVKNENGEKDSIKNLALAAKFKPTYAEFSKSGGGLHLHYIYDGDIDMLEALYDKDIEIKVQKGNSSFRRKLSKCNNLPIAHLKEGDLPLRRKKKVLDEHIIHNERELINKIRKALRKEIHSSTHSNVCYIKKVLDDAVEQGIEFDVSNLRQPIINFAASSTNQSDQSLALVAKMQFKSSDEIIYVDREKEEEQPLVIFDIEVFPNLFVLVWKEISIDECHVMVNPSPLEIQNFMSSYRIIGFNNRRYDNHILHARALGYNLAGLYKLSKDMISNGTGNYGFASAYGESYTDIYDYSQDKKSLKKWEIELGISHIENHYDWDKPVPEDKWQEIIDYCINDVKATEAVWFATQGDFKARCILAAIDGLDVNTKTNTHSAKIIFGDDKNYKQEFVYTDLSETFEGYRYEFGKSYYRGEEVGEGGYVFAIPGMYYNVWTFDVASMHPHSIKALNLFGFKYTKRFYDLVLARVHIKHAAKQLKRGDLAQGRLYLEQAGEMFDGKLTPFLVEDVSELESLAGALKIVINSVYGLTSAKFDNPFYDSRNVDNIVAKRGALFMIELKHNLLEMGAKVVHIKTDSIKVENPTEEIKNYIYEFGQKYGYTFEVESVYERMCLVNKAVYIARYFEPVIDDDGHEHWWTATGAQFAEPYVFKTLFSKEPVTFNDQCTTFSVSTSLYLDYHDDADNLCEDTMQFVGKVGRFTPIKKESGGGVLYSKREGKNGAIKFDSPSGTKGYYWLESTIAETYGQEAIDESYYISKVTDALDTIREFGDPEMFINDVPDTEIKIQI